MKKRPLIVTIVSLLFMVIGAGNLIKGIWTLVSGGPGGITGHGLLDAMFVELSGLAALISGLFMLKGANWARWLCIAWMAFHVVISLGHERSKLIVHSVMLVFLVAVLFWPNVAAYFRRQRA